MDKKCYFYILLISVEKDSNRGKKNDKNKYWRKILDKKILLENQ